MRILPFSIFLFFLPSTISCFSVDAEPGIRVNLQPSRVDSIPIPSGYSRIPLGVESFGNWLRGVKLKKDNRVFLFNGQLKSNQRAQYAVLDISVGEKDLQQCADAVMRLRAEYLFSRKQYDSIWFRDNESGIYRWKNGADRTGWTSYLERVFGMCGTASLEKQLRGIRPLKSVQPGDVLIKGGFPGHAMIVMDVIVNKAGDRKFLLAQSYMPAQDIHIVKNPAADDPWYEVNEEQSIRTPEWTFETRQLKYW